MKITQIQPVSGTRVNIKGEPEQIIMVYGLGDDGLLYLWDGREKKWIGA